MVSVVTTLVFTPSLFFRGTGPPTLPPPPSPALALDSYSSSRRLGTNIASYSVQFLDYEQELVQVQEEDKD